VCVSVWFSIHLVFPQFSVVLALTDRLCLNILSQGFPMYVLFGFPVLRGSLYVIYILDDRHQMISMRKHEKWIYWYPEGKVASNSDPALSPIYKTVSIN